MDELAFIKNPHDALFRSVFGDPDNAAELLRSILPAAITAAIDWRTLRRVEGSFVDEALRDKHADRTHAAADLADRAASWLAVVARPARPALAD